MSIHQRIKERRLALGLKSHKALADIVGVSWQTVQLWEKEGGTAPNRNRIDAVAKALKVSPGWLLHGSQDSMFQNDVGTSPVATDLKLNIDNPRIVHAVKIMQEMNPSQLDVAVKILDTLAQPVRSGGEQ